MEEIGKLKDSAGKSRIVLLCSACCNGRASVAIGVVVQHTTSSVLVLVRTRLRESESASEKPGKFVFVYSDTADR